MGLSKQRNAAELQKGALNDLIDDISMIDDNKLIMNYDNQNSDN